MLKLSIARALFAASALAATFSLAAPLARADAAEAVTFDTPTYVVVSRAADAPMATANLPVEEIVFEQPLMVHVSRPETGPLALWSPPSDVMVLVHR